MLVTHVVAKRFLDAFESKWCGSATLDRIAERIDYIEPWTFAKLLQYLRERFVHRRPELQANTLPYFEFLRELRTEMEGLTPDSPEGRECAMLCADLAASELHEIENLFATMVLEDLLSDQPAWRKYFFEIWSGDPNPKLRATLAFATCFTDFEDKQDLLTLLSEDLDEFVRACVLQSLWYRDSPFPVDQRQAVRRILHNATSAGGELVDRFAKDIRRLIPDIGEGKP